MPVRYHPHCCHHSRAGQQDLYYRLQERRCQDQQHPGAVSLTSADEYDDINDTNTVDASISGKKITAKVAFNQWDDLKTAVVATTLPEGAKLYYVDDSEELQPVTVLNEDTEGAPTELPDADTYKYEKNDPAYEALQLVVVSERSLLPTVLRFLALLCTPIWQVLYL